MQKKNAREVQLIPIGQINVLNPRTRNRRIHREIVDNIDAIGLKRPITVRRGISVDGDARYDLVCGQGRLEAFQMLGQASIPAFVIDAPEVDCLVMSLVENIARRQHRPIDLMKEVGELHRRGYSDMEIGAKIGATSSWVNMIIGLLERGEDRLITAVETGLLPLGLATDIARSSNAEVQIALADAYEKKLLKGKKLTAVRHLLEKRARRSKGVSQNTFGHTGPHKKLTAEDLMRLYQREADKQRLLVKKADFTQNRLLFITEAFKDLLRDHNFLKLLKLEKLDTIPKPLSDRIGAKGTR